MAAPHVFARIADHFGANRIEMNITDQLQQISISVTENIFVTSLKQMAYELVLAIEVQCVALLQALHDFGERVFPHFYQ